MKKSKPNGLSVLDDGRFTLHQADFCTVPGYLILRTAFPASGLGDLNPEQAGLLGELLGRAVREIERVTGAERVYCLSFCELDRRLHFHLFPRTRWLLEAYWKASGTADRPVNGPALFEWARDVFVPDAPLPPGAPVLGSVLEELRLAFRAERPV